MNQEEQHISEEMNEISIKELIEIIWGYKWLIILLTIFGAVVAFSAGQVMKNRQDQVQTIVSLEWNGLVDGQYPDGDRFIYNNMFESYVLSDALEETGISNITTSSIRAHLRVVPIVPSNVVQIVQQSLEQGEQITYYATEYRLVLNAGQLDISNEQGKMFLENLIESFKTDFENKYINKAIVLQYTNIDLSTYDYDETFNVLLNQITLFESIINTALESGSNFTSNSLQIGFDDLLSQLTLIHDVDLMNIDTRVNNYMLTKEVDFRISRYEYMIELDTLTLNKALDYKNEIMNNITSYSGNETVVIIPGLDTQYSIDPYINELYKELTNTQKEIVTLENDISYYETKISELEAIIDLNNGFAEEYQIQLLLVENAIVVTQNKIDDVGDNLNTMLDEYNTYITRNTVTPLTAPQVVNETNVMLYTAIGLVLGGMLSLGVVFIMETFKRD